MDDQILTSYGPVDRGLASVVVQSAHYSFLVVDISGSHEKPSFERQLRELVRAHTMKRVAQVGWLFETSATDRWTALMLELFGREHRELLEANIDPTVALIHAQNAVNRSDHVIPDLFAAISMFFIAEANRVRQCIDFLSAGLDTATRAELDAASTKLISQALLLNRHVDRGTWPQLYKQIAETRCARKTPATPAVAMIPTGIKHALLLFKQAAQVPAYREFLAEHGVDPAVIQSADDFRCLPVSTRSDYCGRVRRPATTWSHDIVGLWSASEGSSGDPNYSPHNFTVTDGQHRTSAFLQRDYLRDGQSRFLQSHFLCGQQSKLLIVGMMKTGSLDTDHLLANLKCREQRSPAVSVGVDVESTLTKLAEMGSRYDQVALVGYPPFLRDVLDRASSEILKQDLKLLLTGENISEDWRDQLLKRIGKPDQPDRTCVFYGTAEAGVMGHETPTTIAVRRLARSDRRLARSLFDDDTVLPTFVEYDSRLHYIEVDADERLLFTVDNPVPLVRFRADERGKVMTPQELTAKLDECGHRIPVETSTPDAGFLVVHDRPLLAA